MESRQINDINTEELTVVVSFYCIVERNKYDFGTLQLKQGNKDLILDVWMTEVCNENNHTKIRCSLHFDDELDYSFNNDLTFADLYEPFDSATLFIGYEYEVEPDSITLFIKHEDNTKAIDLTKD